MLVVSAASEKLIIDEEVGSPAAYTRRYRRPEWPGGASGVTIAIGYDMGYTTSTRFLSDWQGNMPQGMIDALEPTISVKGEAAHRMLVTVKSKVDISLEQALHVFDTVDKPRWLANLQLSLPNCDQLAPDCVGALWSLIYNRGASFGMMGDRYIEMRNIKAHMIAEHYAKIPAEFRSMKRLWNNGLVGRREREAQLFERGLSIMNGTHTEGSAPQVRTRQQEVQRSALMSATATSVATGGGTAIQVPRNDDLSGWLIPIAIVTGFLVGGLLMVFLGRHRRLPRSDP